MSFLDEWVREHNAVLKAARLQAELEDPGVPTWYGTALSPHSYHPWSAVAGARIKLPTVMNLDKLHRRVLELMGVEPA